VWQVLLQSSFIYVFGAVVVVSWHSEHVLPHQKTASSPVQMYEWKLVRIYRNISVKEHQNRSTPDATACVVRRTVKDWSLLFVERYVELIAVVKDSFRRGIYKLWMEVGIGCRKLERKRFSWRIKISKRKGLGGGFIGRHHSTTVIHIALHLQLNEFSYWKDISLRNEHAFSNGFPHSQFRSDQEIKLHYYLLASRSIVR
jgi:hypothetical protein